MARSVKGTKSMRNDSATSGLEALTHSVGEAGEHFVSPILRPDGTLEPGTESPLPNEMLVDALELMLRSRLIDQRGISLQRQGRLGVYGESRGQEAASAGSVLALDTGTDWMVPAYRELPAMLRIGLPLVNYWLINIGHPAGWVYPPGLRLFPVQIELAAQLPHAVGLGIGMKQQQTGGVAIAYFGEGSSSEGDFYEAGNLAGLVEAPVVLFCQNNEWAISTPRARQTKARTIAAKAAAFGIPGYVVDGNDLMAVYAVTRAVVDRARAGAGPALIEAQTYRLAAHNTADDPTKYTIEQDQEGWTDRDPIVRLRRYLVAQGLWDSDREQTFEATALSEIDASFKEAEAIARTRSVDMLFEHVYAELPPRLQQQRERIRGEAS